MGRFRFTDVAGSTESLASESTKKSNSLNTTPATHSSFTITPASDEYVQVTSVAGEIAADSSAAGRTVTLTYISGTVSGDVGSITTQAADTRCTSNTFTAQSTSGDPLVQGTIGGNVSLSIRIKSSESDATGDMCSQNRSASGRKIKRVQNTFRRLTRRF